MISPRLPAEALRLPGMHAWPRGPLALLALLAL